jgi:hypothetical protein
MPDTTLHAAQRRSTLAKAMGEHALRVALRHGAWHQPWPGVVVPKDRVLDPLTRAAAAVLFAGKDAVLSGRTAAALYGCSVAASPQVHLTLPYNRWVRRRPGLVVHHDRFAEEDVGELHGLPIFAFDLVIAELLCTASRRLALACTDQALAAVGPDLVDQVAARLECRDDRRGTRRAAALLELATGRADSPPESWLLLMVVDAGFPVPQAQHEVHDLAGRLVYVLDLAWPELRIALEYDGFEAHENRVIADAVRDARLADRGWTVIRVRAPDLWNSRPLLDELAAAFNARKYPELAA